MFLPVLQVVDFFASLDFDESSRTRVIKNNLVLIISDVPVQWKIARYECSCDSSGGGRDGIARAFVQARQVRDLKCESRQTEIPCALHLITGAVVCDVHAQRPRQADIRHFH